MTEPRGPQEGGGCRKCGGNSDVRFSIRIGGMWVECKDSSIHDLTVPVGLSVRLWKKSPSDEPLGLLGDEPIFEVAEGISIRPKGPVMFSCGCGHDCVSVSQEEWEAVQRSAAEIEALDKLAECVRRMPRCRGSDIPADHCPACERDRALADLDAARDAKP